MNYLPALQLMKNTFSGGGEGALHLHAVDALRTPLVDWLEIGMGDSNQSLLDIRDHFISRGQTFRLTGVDPCLITSEFSREQFPDAELFSVPFEEFSTERTFDVICATQSFYYLQETKHQLERCISLLKDGGQLMITNWSHSDTLYKIHCSLFPNSSSALTGEEIHAILHSIPGVRDIEIQYFQGSVDFSPWTQNDQTCIAGLHVVSRAELPTSASSAVFQLRTVLSEYQGNQPRINAVITARKAL